MLSLMLSQDTCYTYSVPFHMFFGYIGMPLSYICLYINKRNAHTSQCLILSANIIGEIIMETIRAVKTRDSNASYGLEKLLSN